MGFNSSGRIEVPNNGTLDLEFSNNREEIYGYQIHTTVPMHFTGEGFEADTGQNSDSIIIRRASAGVVQQLYTEIDGAAVFNTTPISFYPMRGTHKVHVLNESGGAGYLTIFKISAGRYH